MGAANSSLSAGSTLPPGDEITTVSERVDGEDPIRERIRSLEIASPLLKSDPETSDNSLKDILLKKPSSDPSALSALDSKFLYELFSLYRDWVEKRTVKICQKQEEIENKIETVDALAVKLLQRFNYSTAAMRTTANNLSEVQQLQVDVGVLKGRLTEVISNCDSLCKRIAAGPGSGDLIMTVKPEGEEHNRQSSNQNLAVDPDSDSSQSDRSIL